MMRFRTSVAALAAFCATAASSAPPKAPEPCLSRAEAVGFISWAMPGLISGVVGRCRPLLPGDAYLTRSGDDLANRYRANSAAAWPTARSAIGKISGGSIPTTLGDDTVRTLAEAGITAALTGKIKASHCGMVNRILEVLAPLPAANMSGLITVLIEIGSRTKQNSNFTICPDD